MKSARGIYDNRIEAVTLGVFYRFFGNFYGVNLSFLENFDPDFTRDRL